jgi:hypothetical protein
MTPVFTSVFETTKGFAQTKAASGNNASAVVTIPSTGQAIHIREIIALYSDGVTSKTMTVVQGSTTKSYTVTGYDGLTEMFDADFAPNTSVVVTLPASGSANVFGVLVVKYTYK